MLGKCKLTLEVFAQGDEAPETLKKYGEVTLIKFRHRLANQSLSLKFSPVPMDEFNALIQSVSMVQTHGYGETFRLIPGNAERQYEPEEIDVFKIEFGPLPELSVNAVAMKLRLERLNFAQRYTSLRYWGEAHTSPDGEYWVFERSNGEQLLINVC